MALFPTVHLLCDRQGLLMYSYGRESRSLNNGPLFDLVS